MRHRSAMRSLRSARCRLAIISISFSGSALHPQDISLISSTVELQIREVNLHLDSSTVLEIKALRGEMVPTRKNRPVTLDDTTSFVTRISQGEIAISLGTLSALLNQRVFAYPHAPLKNITLKADGGRIKQSGTMHKGVDVPFEIEGSLEATQTGEIRLHADKVTSAHIPMKGLLHLFGEDLSKLVNLKQDRGVTIEGDNIVIRTDRILPPPRIEGRVTSVRIQADRIVLSFDSGSADELKPPYKTGSYIFHRGGFYGLEN